MGKRLLIADDEEYILDILVEVFSGLSLEIDTARTGDEALKKIDEKRYDVVLTDLKMPGCDGLTVLRAAKELQPECEVIMMTGYGTIETAVEAMKLGAFHYITKPFKIDEVRLLVLKALEHSRYRRENVTLRKQVRNKYSFENIIGTSPAMMEVLSLVEKVADTDSTILILGESGTGKEMIARAIHYNSSRANNLLVPVNCGAIPEDLLESELFGHVKGAFTGAVAPRAGRFELANHGTIFLDEIGEMSPKLQVKLLRVLQEKEFEPVGSTKTIRVDVRVIAATNKDLEEEVRQGRFREDLYYRLNVIPIRIPPLRERKEDIPLLLSYFIDLYNEKKGRHLEGVTDEAMEILLSYPWPGNVRELENLVERIVVIKGQGKITVEDLPEKMRTGKRTVIPGDELVAAENPFPVNLKEAVDRLEIEMIKKALKMAGGNKEMAASLLGIKRTTLIEKIKRKNIEV
ncbi:MAG: sigma-54-dependent Fis family transcriptional regulator [Deltaproteobacteria bacterium]|nr:MAG: sigma-54-dependent Fis family transcriptional regulator [Deltaproteobacteria bacterium]